MQNKFFFILILVLSFGLTNASAQTPTPVKTISGGVINGKATSLPKPAYPAAAQAIGASGAVNVQVTIDEKGNVISASAVSGHPLLRQAAEQAARLAKFLPTKLSGQPVKVTGVIVYNFVPNKNNEEKVKILGLGTVLFILHSSASDLGKLTEVFGPEGLLDGIAEEFPRFTKELAPIALLEKAPNEKRLEIIDDVINSIQAKLSGSDIWQFEMGKNFGEFMAPFFRAASRDDIDLSEFNESALRLNLSKIKELINSAPPEFPTDVLEKFKQFADIDGQEEILMPENLQELLKKLEAIFETISPGSTE